jgi:hypothetical protein
MNKMQIGLNNWWIISSKQSLPVSTFSNDSDVRAECWQQSKKLQFRLGQNLYKRHAKTWVNEILFDLNACRLYFSWFLLIVSRKNHRNVTENEMRLGNFTYLGFDYPNHKSLGIRGQVFKSEINFWGEIPPCYGLLP